MGDFFRGKGLSNGLHGYETEETSDIDGIKNLLKNKMTTAR